MLIRTWKYTIPLVAVGRSCFNLALEVHLEQVQGTVQSLGF